MVKKRMAVIIVVLFSLVMGGLKMTEIMFGFDILPDMPAITPRQKQLKYLKDHEQEIIDFVKSQNPKIESVQIDWEDVRWSSSPSMFTQQHYLNIYGRFNNIERSGWSIIFYIEDNEISIENMNMSGPITTGGLIYE